jgi:hypothetical protein
LDLQLPQVEICSPEGQKFKVEVTKDRITIGRFRDFNDIALEPDPQQLVTRIGHFTIERDAAGWWVVDNGSVNKTFLKWGQTTKVVEGKAPLGDGDVIRILGRLSESGEPHYWELTFSDPMRTIRADSTPQNAYLEYNWIQAKLFRIDGNHRQEIEGLRPQEHKLIRYMDQRNRSNGNVPVMCTYEELIEAIWDEESFGHTEVEINRLVWELRKKLDPDPKEHLFLQTVRGLGYRLVTRPIPS